MGGPRAHPPSRPRPARQAGHPPGRAARPEHAAGRAGPQAGGRAGPSAHVPARPVVCGGRFAGLGRARLGDRRGLAVRTRGEVPSSPPSADPGTTGEASRPGGGARRGLSPWVNPSGVGRSSRDRFCPGEVRRPTSRRRGRPSADRGPRRRGLRCGRASRGSGPGICSPRLRGETRGVDERVVHHRAGAGRGGGNSRGRALAHLRRRAPGALARRARPQARVAGRLVQSLH